MLIAALIAAKEGRKGGDVGERRGNAQQSACETEKNSVAGASGPAAGTPGPGGRAGGVICRKFVSPALSEIPPTRREDPEAMVFSVHHT